MRPATIRGRVPRPSRDGLHDQADLIAVWGLLWGPSDQSRIMYNQCNML